MSNKIKQIVLSMNRVKLIFIVTVATIVAALLSDMLISKIFGYKIIFSEMFVKVSLIPMIVVPTVGWYLLGLIYELDKLERKMTTLATYDDLTGLLTRRAFYDSAQTMANFCYRNGQSYSILVVDLDFFKKINDTYGHAGGDKVLASFGMDLIETSRTSDIIGRLGGEEFAFFLPNTTADQAKVFARRLREKINSTEIVYKNQIIKYHISIGISSNEKNINVGIDQLLASADKALYRAKNNGRNQEVIQELELDIISYT